jgi:DNA-binding transcriptional LysR family regulator
MELRHLKYFLAVAEELNFTRAAKRLNIAQPPLTQQIKALEAEIGVMLFDRSAYRIELTEGGRVFMGEAARILRDVPAAVLAARHAATGKMGQVRVGFTESATFNPLVTAAFREFRSAYPDVVISLVEHQSRELAKALRDDRIDVAYVRPPLSNAEGLVLHRLEDEDMVIAIPISHHMTKRKTIELRELANETFILYPRSVRPGLADVVIAACEEAGFTPQVAQYAPQMSSTINLVAASLGVSIVPRSMEGMQARAVAYREIRGRPLQALLALAHRSKEKSIAARNFIEVARMVNGAMRVPGNRLRCG